VAFDFRQQLTGFVAAAIGGIVMAVTGALETGAAPIGIRLLFWLTVMLTGALIGTTVSLMVKGWGGLKRWRWIEALAIAVAMSVPQTLVVIAARSLVFDLRVPDSSGISILYGFVLFICVVMVALELAMNKGDQAETAPVQPAVEPPVAAPSTPELRFRERLPHGLRTARLLALEAEDHYLRVHTDNGSGLILLRLADAVAELEAVEGAQTHRSWWVARAAVAEAKRSDGRAILTLEGGQEVPVSRSFYKAINDSGWLN
jgi:hypothetical protein